MIDIDGDMAFWVYDAGNDVILLFNDDARISMDHGLIKILLVITLLIVYFLIRYCYRLLKSDNYWRRYRISKLLLLFLRISQFRLHVHHHIGWAFRSPHRPAGPSSRCLWCHGRVLLLGAGWGRHHRKISCPHGRASIVGWKWLIFDVPVELVEERRQDGTDKPENRRGINKRPRLPPPKV